MTSLTRPRIEEHSNHVALQTGLGQWKLSKIDLQISKEILLKIFRFCHFNDRFCVMKVSGVLSTLAPQLARSWMLRILDFK